MTTILGANETECEEALRDSLQMSSPFSIAVGSSVGLSLFERGLVSIARHGRYGITPAGVAALYGPHAQTPPTFRASNNRATNQGRQRVIRK